VPASKFTYEARIAILARLEAGTTLSDAARAAGIRLPTLKRWLTRGRNERQGPYADFARAVDAAKEASEGPMTFESFLAQLEKSVRAGNVQAMKLWWEIERGNTKPDRENPASRQDDAAEDPFEALDAADELAQARARRAQAS
jgi:hypothetical protein